jgi:hypothetical protein
VDFKILTDRVVVTPFIPDRYFSLAQALMQVVYIITPIAYHAGANFNEC